jgi:hypothetical protein
MVEGEDLLGDGVNIAARLKRGMSTPAGTETRHLRKSQPFFNSLLEQQSVQGCWITPTALSTACADRSSCTQRRSESAPRRQSPPDN